MCNASRNICASLYNNHAGMRVSQTCSNLTILCRWRTHTRFAPSPERTPHKLHLFMCTSDTHRIVYLTYDSRILCARPHDSRPGGVGRWLLHIQLWLRIYSPSNVREHIRNVRLQNGMCIRCGSIVWQFAHGYLYPISKYNYTISIKRRVISAEKWECVQFDVKSGLTAVMV